MFRSLYEPLGLPKEDLYSLRHFSITKKLDYNRHDYESLAKDTAHRQLSTIQDYYETPEDSVRIDTAKAIGKFLSRSGKSDSESEATSSSFFAKSSSAREIVTLDSESDLPERLRNFPNGRGILKVFDKVRSTRPDAKRRAVFHVTKTEKEIEAKTERIYVAPEVIFMLRDYKLVQNQHKQLAGNSYIDDD